MRKWLVRKNIIILSAVVFVILAGAGIAFQSYLGAVGNGQTKVDFEIKSGNGPIIVANRLYEEKIIRSRTAFKMYLNLTGKTSSIKAGIYSLDDSMGIPGVVKAITSGSVKTFTLTIPEGYHNRQIAERFVQKRAVQDLNQFKKITESPELLARYKIPAASVEGYLFPDTYTFPVSYPPEKMVDAMVKNFFNKTRKIEGFPAHPQEIQNLVILASIVEREAKRQEERALIAGVFSNRLKKNYPLESCATIQYLLDKPKVRLYYYHLEMDSPYNTYKKRGLPPGPIANPGLESIKAALHPEPTEYMFFVVKDDEGRHEFSKSFSEHNRAKKQYILH